MPEFHAKLSPSDSKRWLFSPGCLGASLAGIAKYRHLEPTSSVYADEGTFAHSLAEYRLAKQHGLPYDGKPIKELKKDPYYSKYVSQLVNEYVRNVNDIIKSYKNDIISINLEVKVSMTRVHKDCWGTSDVVLITNKGIHVIDLKFGKGVAVSAIDNPQLRLYAYGAYETLDVSCKGKAYYTIIQPKLYSITTGCMWLDDLERWADWAHERAMLAVSGEEKPTPTFDTCRWCAIKYSDKTHAKAFLATVGIKLSDLRKGRLKLPKFKDLTPKELGAILENADDIKRWLDGVKAEATNQVYTGKKITGFKLVRGRSFRVLNDEEKAVKALKAYGLKRKDITKTSVLGITDLEALLGKTKFNKVLGDCVSTRTSKNTLVPVSHRGTEIVPPAMAKDDFGIFED